MKRIFGRDVIMYISILHKENQICIVSTLANTYMMSMTIELLRHRDSRYDLFYSEKFSN